jgi:hypothetical protein
MKCFKKNIIYFILAFYRLAVNAKLVRAQPDLGLDNPGSFDLPAGDPGNVLANIVKLLLAFSGVIAVSVFIFGYFSLMVASGNEDKEHAAKKSMISSVIGLILIISSYLIVGFVFNKVSSVLSLQAKAGF